MRVNEEIDMAESASLKMDNIPIIFKFYIEIFVLN